MKVFYCVFIFILPLQVCPQALFSNGFDSFMNKHNIVFKMPKGFILAKNNGFYPNETCDVKDDFQYVIDMESFSRKKGGVYIFIDFSECSDSKKNIPDIFKNLIPCKDGFLNTINKFADTLLMKPIELDSTFTKSIGFDLANCFKRNCINISDNGMKYRNLTYSLYKADEFQIRIAFLYTDKYLKKINKIFNTSKRMFVVQEND